MRRLRLFPIPAALLAVWAFASGFTLNGFFGKYAVQKPITQTVTKSPSIISRETVAQPAAQFKEELYQGEKNRPIDIDQKITTLEPLTCYETEDHTTSAKAIMDDLNKTPLFSDACFLYNTLVGVWESSRCRASLPQRVDCCAEMSGRYAYLFNLLQISVRWNTCSYDIYSSACVRMNSDKQQCDTMNCSQNCDWTYDCSPNGYSATLGTVPINNDHPDELSSCRRAAGFR